MRVHALAGRPGPYTRGPARTRPARRAPRTAAAAPQPATGAPFWAETVPSTLQADRLDDARATLVSQPDAGPLPVGPLVAAPGARCVLVVARSMGCPFCQCVGVGVGQQW